MNLPAASIKRLIQFICVATLGACTTSNQPPQSYLRLHGTTPKSSHQFAICNRPGCEETVVVTLSDADWMLVEDIFSPPARDNKEERRRIALAVALFERLVASQAGTGDDQAGPKGVFRGTRQLDCIAETANTTSYLVLLHERGLMLRHAPRYPQHRGFMHGEFPHNTAVMEEVQTGERYAVDAYFHTNGAPPEIVPIQAWIDGFKPDDIQNSL